MVQAMPDNLLEKRGSPMKSCFGFSQDFRSITECFIGVLIGCLLIGALSLPKEVSAKRSVTRSLAQRSGQRAAEARDAADGAHRITYRPKTIADALENGRLYHVLCPRILTAKKANWIAADERESNCARGNTALLHGEWQEAVDAYTETLRKNPQNCVALAHRSIANEMNVFFGSGRDPLAFIDNLTISLSHDLTKSILSDTSSALAMHPGDPTLICNWATQTALFAHDPKKAVFEAQKAASLAPSDVIALHTLASLEKSIGRNEEAVRVLDKGLQLSPNSDLLLVERGTTLFRLGQYGQSIKDLSTALTLDPANAYANYERALSLYCLGNSAAAQRDLESATRDLPTYASTWQVRSVNEIRLEMYKQAISSAEQALHAGAPPGECHYQQALAYGGLGQSPMAMAKFNEALKESPNNTRILTDRGILKAKLGHTNAAIQDLDQAIAADPGQINALRARGKLYGIMGQLEQSTCDLLAAKQLIARGEWHKEQHGANFSISPPSLGILHEHVKISQEYVRGAMPTAANQSEAFKGYTDLIALSPKNGALYYNRAIVCICMNNLSTAIQDLETATKLIESGRASVLSQLLTCGCLRKLGREQEADSLLARIARPDADPFMAKLLQFEQRRCSEEDLLKTRAITDGSIAHYFVALRKIRDKQINSAKSDLIWIRDNADQLSDEYILALYELGTLERKKS